MRKTRRLGRQAVAKMLADLCSGNDACPAEDPNARCPFRSCDCENIDADRWLEAMKEPEDGSDDEPEDKPEDKPEYSFGDKITVDGERAIYLFYRTEDDTNEVIFERNCVSSTVEDCYIEEGW